MFFSDKSPFSSVSFKTCFLLRIFCKDFFRFVASKVETLLVSVGLSGLGADWPPLPKGSLLKLLLSEPYVLGLSVGLPGSF